MNELIEFSYMWAAMQNDIMASVYDGSPLPRVVLLQNEQLNMKVNTKLAARHGICHTTRNLQQ